MQILFYWIKYMRATFCSSWLFQYDIRYRVLVFDRRSDRLHSAYLGIHRMRLPNFSPVNFQVFLQGSA